MRRRRVLFAAIAGIAAASQLRARGSPPSFGVQSGSAYVVTAWEMQPASSASQWLDDPADGEFRSVTAKGTYGATTLTAPTDGGYWVVTPMKLDSGQTVLVNRGRLPTTKSVPETPTGPVALEGRLRRPAKAIADLDVAGADAPLLIEAQRSTPSDSGDLTPEPFPDLENGPPNLSYAVQWWIFSACAVVGWVLVVRRKSRPPSLATRKPGKRRNQAVPWRDT